MGTGLNGAWQFALGHRRLAIIDLTSTGQQPMKDEAGRIIAFNGEIYNYIELRRELAEASVTFKSSSDTEVLLAALARWGVDALPKLVGMFAFAYYDPSDNSMLIARDPFGKKPMYVAELSSGGAVFSSEIDPISRFPGVDRRADLESVAEYLQFRYVPGPHTMMRGITKIPPGSYFRWTPGGTTQGRYYTPPTSTLQDEGIDHARDRVAKCLREAVAIRLRSDAPFGVFLSGGLDSTIILALMSELLGRAVPAFSIAFDEAGYSELGFAALAANRYGAHHQVMTITPDYYSSAINEALVRRGAPVSEPADIPIMLLSKLASGSVKMVMTGEGSDEIFAGYPKHQVEHRLRYYYSVVPQAVHDRLLTPLIEALPYGARRAQIACRAVSERNFNARMVAWLDAQPNSLQLHVGTSITSRRPLDAFPFSSGSTPLKRALFFDQTSWLPDNLLERGDRMMMAGGLEGRMPFLDVRLAALASKLPDPLLVGRGAGKVILREAFADMVPQPILRRKKNGFRVPIGEWFQGALRDYLEDCLFGADARCRELFDQAVLRRQFAEHVTRRRNHEKRLWTALNLELFCKNYDLSF
jgi:asparagine synthase (glutamine-hydrolysing)